MTNAKLFGSYGYGGTCWLWKKIPALRLVTARLRVQLGNGHKTRFWNEPWMPGGTIFIVYNCPLKVSDFYYNDRWHLTQIQNRMAIKVIRWLLSVNNSTLPSTSNDLIATTGT